MDITGIDKQRDDDDDVSTISSGIGKMDGTPQWLGWTLGVLLQQQWRSFVTQQLAETNQVGLFLQLPFQSKALFLGLSNTITMKNHHA